MYKIDVRVLGMVATNCYLLCNTDTKECVLIDPAYMPSPPFLGKMNAQELLHHHKMYRYQF